MSLHPLEGKLRPLWEGYIVLASCSAAAIALRLPWQSPLITGIDAVLFLLIAGGFGVRGAKVYSYQRGLRVLKPYAMDEALIPRLIDKRLLGRGFRWTARHTQRITDLYSPDGLNFQERRWFEPKQAVAGEIAVHGVGGPERDIIISQTVREGHVLVYGASGASKTAFCRFMGTQDILSKRGAVVFFDPKNDPDLRMTAEAGALSTGVPFYAFDLGNPPGSCCYNPLAEWERITELAGRATQGLSDSDFSEYAWFFSNIVAQGLVAMGEEVTLEGIRLYLPKPDTLLIALWDQLEDPTKRPPREKNLETRGWHETAARIAHRVNQHPSEHRIINIVADVLRWKAEYYGKISNNLLPQLDKLITGPVGELFLPSKSRPSFSWRQALDEKAVVYVSLLSLADPEVANAVGRMMIADLASLAGSLIAKNQKRVGFFHIDELADLLGGVFTNMANKTRQAGFCLTGYTQTSSDMVEQLGGTAAANRVTGNFNTLILFRSSDEETGGKLIKKLRGAKVMTATQVNLATHTSDTDKNSDYSSHAGDRLHQETVDMLSVADLAALPDGHGFALIKGNGLFKFRFPLLT